MRAKIALANLVILSWGLAIDLSLTGCSSMQARKKPSKEDIVGTWAPDGKTLEYLKSEGRYPDSDEIKLTFKNDGDFESVLPDWFFNLEGKSFSTTRSISGKWEVWTANDRVWEILLSYNATSRLHVRWDRSRYILYSFVGDPDNDKTMDFVRLR